MNNNPHCARNCKHFMECKLIPKNIWKLPPVERDKKWRKIARECKHYEKEGSHENKN